jgi:hypothetical protein
LIIRQCVNLDYPCFGCGKEVLDDHAGIHCDDYHCGYHTSCINTVNNIDDVLSLNNSRFDDFVDPIYPIELEIKETTNTDRSASCLHHIQHTIKFKHIIDMCKMLLATYNTQ